MRCDTSTNLQATWIFLTYEKRTRPFSSNIHRPFCPALPLSGCCELTRWLEDQTLSFPLGRKWTGHHALDAYGEDTSVWLDQDWRHRAGTFTVIWILTNKTLPNLNDPCLPGGLNGINLLSFLSVNKILCKKYQAQFNIKTIQNYA